MPELPEVETIKRSLTKSIVGQKIKEVKIYKPGVIKEPSVVKFKKGLVGQEVKEVLRRAKVLILCLSSGDFLIIHLRIAGWLLYGVEDPKARVVFKFSNGKCLNYMDQRLLGELRLKKNYRDFKFIKTLGPEPFDLKLKNFEDILRSKKTKIKSLIMDQTVIAGLGNIYAQEALFLSKIDPQRPANSLKSKEVKLLHNNMAAVLKEGIKHRGSSVDLYRDLEGKKGGMEERLQVYGRKGRSCYCCGSKIAKVALAGRGTCFCPRCQK